MKVATNTAGAKAQRSYLSDNERFYIEKELKDGTPVREIARKLKRDKSTIYKEIRRGTMLKRVKPDEQSRKFTDEYGYHYVKEYSCEYAQLLAERRQAAKGTSLKIGKDVELAKKIERLIKEENWSPKTAVERLRKTGELTTDICWRTVYNYVYDEVLDVEMKDLPMHGMRKKAHAKKYKKAKRSRIGTSIELRPPEVDERNTFGHWEGDLVVGKQGTKKCVLTLIERLTRKYIVRELPSKESKNVIRELDRLESKFGRLWSEVFKTITWDNGVEFSDAEGIERSRYARKRGPDGKGGRCKAYYAHTYTSCERGSNENANGLLRRAGVTKGKNIALLPKGTVKKAGDWVNALPREILGWATADEAFADEVAKIEKKSKMKKSGSNKVLLC